MTEYLNAVYQGRNQWWRYASGLGVILFLWLIVGSIPAVGVVLMAGGDSLEAIDPLALFLVTMASFLCLLAGVFLAVRVIHGRRMLTLVTPARQVNWRRAAQGFGVWLALATALALVEALAFPGRYQWALDSGRFAVFAAPVVVLIPIQATTEELLFRGYLLQALGLRLRNAAGLSICSGVLFMLPHLANPEMAAGFWLLAAYYFAFGVFAAYLTLKDGGLELAMGLHTANNLFAGLVANYPNSALPTPTLFMVSALDPAFNLAGALVAFACFYAVVFWAAGRAVVASSMDSK